MTAPNVLHAERARGGRFAEPAGQQHPKRAEDAAQGKADHHRSPSVPDHPPDDGTADAQAEQQNGIGFVHKSSQGWAVTTLAWSMEEDGFPSLKQ
jgi:hypothetical protein